MCRCEEWEEKTYYGYDPIRFEESVEILEELNGEKLNRFCTTSEHVVDDIIIFGGIG